MLEERRVLPPANPYLHHHLPVPVFHSEIELVAFQFFMQQ